MFHLKENPEQAVRQVNNHLRNNYEVPTGNQPEHHNRNDKLNQLEHHKQNNN
jgi:hypothetical protein